MERAAVGAHGWDADGGTIQFTAWSRSELLRQRSLFFNFA
jgi:hypothetical protein